MTLAALEDSLPPSRSAVYLTNGPESTLPQSRALIVNANTSASLVDDGVANLTLTPKTSLAKTANYTLLATDAIDVLVDATAGNITVTVPTASTALEGKEYRILKTDAGVHTVAWGGTVHGAVALASQYDYSSIKCLGSAWYVTAQLAA